MALLNGIQSVKTTCSNKVFGLSQTDLPSAIENFRQCRRLRQQLEKVRLLLELIKKRERLKLEQVPDDYLYISHLAFDSC